MSNILFANLIIDVERYSVIVYNIVDSSAKPMIRENNKNACTFLLLLCTLHLIVYYNIISTEKNMLTEKRW